MKIYISGTYGDLQKHRAAVAAVLRRMGHQPIGMEDYVAESARPLRRCLADVALCDAYVGIIAWRYGHVPPTNEVLPPGLTPPPDTVLGQTSITEFEFRYAVSLNKPVLMFLVDPACEWPSTEIDAVQGLGDAGKAVALLRQDVAQNFLVSFFRSPEELAGLVSAAIYRTEMDRQMKLESLQIDAQFNQPFIRTNDMVDTTLMTIKDVIAGQRDIQALQVNIGNGHDWWMTRLYFLTSLAAELTALEVVVFQDGSERFIGIIHPRIVKEQLARSSELIRQYESDLASQPLVTLDLRAEIDRRVNIWNGKVAAAGGEGANPQWVTRPELLSWLSPYMTTQALDLGAGDNAVLLMQRLMDWPMRFVPIAEQGKFTRIVDKQALAEQIAKSFVREQVSRALSSSR